MAKTKTRDRDRDAGPGPRNDAYVMMLVITLVALITATVLMYLDFGEYGSKAPPKETIPTPAKLGEATGKGVDDGKAAEPKVDPKGDGM